MVSMASRNLWRMPQPCLLMKHLIRMEFPARAPFLLQALLQLEEERVRPQDPMPLQEAGRSIRAPLSNNPDFCDRFFFSQLNLIVFSQATLYFYLFSSVLKTKSYQQLMTGV